MMGLDDITINMMFFIKNYFELTTKMDRNIRLKRQYVNIFTDGFDTK